MIDHMQRFIQKHSPRDGEFEADLIRAIRDLDSKAIAFAAPPKSLPSVGTVAKLVLAQVNLHLYRAAQSVEDA